MFALNGESGIRTHASFRTNGFQDRLVMTASISLQTCFSIIQDKKRFVKSFFNLFFLVFSYFVAVHQQLSYNIMAGSICQHFFYIFSKIKMSTLNSTFFHIFIVLPFCTIRSLFYCIFSLLGSAIVRLPLLPASHAPYFRSYASCFTSSSNSSPAE